MSGTDASSTYLCHYGFNNHNKDLVITPTHIMVNDNGTELFNVAMNDVVNVAFSTNNIRIKTINGSNYILRGVKSPDNTFLAHYYRSVSDSKALAAIREQLNSYGKQTISQPFIIDKSVLLFLFVCIIAMAVILFAVRFSH